MLIWASSRVLADCEKTTAADVDHGDLLCIFHTLMRVKAREFEVELNFDLPLRVKERLGDVPFEIVLQKRPYDSSIRPWISKTRS